MVTQSLKTDPHPQEAVTDCTIRDSMMSPFEGVFQFVPNWVHLQERVCVCVYNTVVSVTLSICQITKQQTQLLLR